MKDNLDSPKVDKLVSNQAIYGYDTPVYRRNVPRQIKHHTSQQQNLAGILVISSYPPRECVIATDSQDLIKALNNKFSNTFNIKVCAMSCVCPIIFTSIPHAKEMLTEDTGIILNFENSGQLTDGVIHLLNNHNLIKNIILNTLHKIISTSWKNSVVVHALLIQKMVLDKVNIRYNLPEINLNHIKAMTTDVSMIQFSKINQLDIKSGYIESTLSYLIAQLTVEKYKNEQ